MALGRELDDAPYARVLGFRRSAAPLLSAVKSHSSIPLITKLAGAKKSLPEKRSQYTRSKSYYIFCTYHVGINKNM